VGIVMCYLTRSGCLNFLHLRQYSFLLLPLPSILKGSKAAATILLYWVINKSSAIDIKKIFEYYNLFFSRPSFQSSYYYN
jgi:hypothetical protein